MRGISILFSATQYHLEAFLPNLFNLHSQLSLFHGTSPLLFTRIPQNACLRWRTEISNLPQESQEEPRITRKYFEQRLRCFASTSACLARPAVHNRFYRQNSPNSTLRGFHHQLRTFAADWEYVTKAKASSDKASTAQLLCQPWAFIIPGKIRKRLQVRLTWSLIPQFSKLTKNLADFYHVRCFEKIADFSQAPFAILVTPVTRHNWKACGIEDTSVRQGHYILDGGAERLVIEWKNKQFEYINARDGVDDKSERPIPGTEDIYYNAGAPGFQSECPPGMTVREHSILRRVLAPYESDWSRDPKPWNLFRGYLSVQDPESLNDRHSLSTMLMVWFSQKVGPHGPISGIKQLGKLIEGTDNCRLRRRPRQVIRR